MDRMEAKEKASEQECWGWNRGRAGGRHLRDRPGDQGCGGVSGTRRRPGTAGGRPRNGASSVGEQEGQEEQVAHASGVAMQGGRGTRLQDRGHAVADLWQAAGSGAARWCPGRRSEGRLKSWGRLAHSKTKEQPRGPRGRRQETGQELQVSAQRAGGRLGRGTLRCRRSR